MKKFSLYFAPLLLALFTITSCDDDGPFWDCEEGRGPEKEIVLDVDGFKGIKLNCNADVFITQGTDFEVVAKGEENIIEQLETDVHGSVWDIEFDHCTRDYDLKIYITMPEINYLSIAGSGKIKGENFFTADDLELRISGSGKMDLGLNAHQIDGKISGSGEMLLEGATDHLDFDISGSGDLHAFDLAAKTADLNVSGSGDAEVQVLDNLDVKISGSGDVFYKGYPVLNVNISGSGKVRSAN
ncbi:MAG: head GIN domain-containing protein [Saprospiraceae bacterium]